MGDSREIEAVRRNAIPLSGRVSDLRALLEAIGNASYVLIGEVLRETHEFYTIRAEIPKRPNQEHGFLAVAMEADWPEAHRIDRSVRAHGRDKTPRQALADLNGFPAGCGGTRWVEQFAGCLRAYNDSRSKNTSGVGFYSVDLYSMNTRAREVPRPAVQYRFHHIHGHDNGCLRLRRRRRNKARTSNVRSA
jgi:erythromycin esterase-like protein